MSWAGLCISILLLSAAEPKSGRGGYVSPALAARKTYKLVADNHWLLTLPENRPFDASGLLRFGDDLLIINDRVPELQFVRLHPEHRAVLEPSGWFTFQQGPNGKPPPSKKYDAEGIARDAKGNLYISEESTRSIFRQGQLGKLPERLDIDWSPVAKYFKGGVNASFEGIAIGDGKLWVANERDEARIIIVDLLTLKVQDSFAVTSTGFAFGGSHYSDLSWHQGSLFVLDRNFRSILKVDPSSRRVTAEYSFAEMELQEELAYRTQYPTGAMEGLSVDDQFFWLVTDNNGLPRAKYPSDRRPALFRCKRPDAPF